MAEEIKTTKELRKALGELMMKRGTGPFHEEINYYNVLGLINSFEAGLWERLEWNKVALDKGENRRIGAIKELRKLLEGGDGEKETER